MASEVRAVGVEAFEEVYPLLCGFPTKTMSKEDWRQMLFAYPWTENPKRGFGLYVDGKAVGFLGTIFSARELAGRMERVCSLSSWIVLPEHRDASIKLVTPILRLKDHTILNPTPSPVAYEIFKKLGFIPLESERLILPPVPGVGEAARALTGSFSRARKDLLSGLSGQEKKLYDDLSSCAVAQHVLLRRGSRSCYVVATPVHRRGVPFAEVQYIGDREFFWDHRILAHAALFPSTRAAGLWVDKRFAPARGTPPAFRWSSRRLYRPTRKEIVPEMIDGLYSELMGLRW
jgi:hypothetical protein